VTPRPARGRRPARCLALALLLAGALPLAAQSGLEGPQRSTLRLLSSRGDTLVLQVEVARTPAERRRGLQRRDALPDDAGMLFLFPGEQPASASFWMHRTRIPLSIAFLDAAGTVRAVRDMEPCRAILSFFCARYAAGVPFHAALEVNRGYFARHGIAPGSRILVAALR